MLSKAEKQVAELQTQLIATTLKCLGASLRCHQSILDFLKHPDRLLLRTIQLINQSIGTTSIIQSGLLALKQLFSSNSEVYDLVEEQLEAQYVKIFISQIMVMSRKNDAEIQELAFVCLL